MRIQLAVLALCLFSLVQGRLFLQADPSNDITKPSSHSKLSKDGLILDFYWDFSEDNESVMMMIEINQQGYFGFGWGESMDNADIWIFEIFEESIIASDRYSRKKGYPPKDETAGGTEDLEVVGYQYNDNGKTIVKFKRKVNTGDKYDEILVQQELVSVIVAFGLPADKTTAYHHERRDKFGIKFIQGYDSDATDYDDDYGWYKWHRMTNLICWGIASDVGIIFARYWKTSRFRMGVHGLIMGMLSIASFVATYLMLQQHFKIFKWETFYDEPKKTKLHFIFGMILGITIIAQCIGGFLLRKLISTKLINEQVSEKPSIHAIIGHILYVIGKINIGIGIYIYPEDFYKNGLWIIYPIIFLWRIAFELLYRNNQLVGLIVGKPSQKQIQPNSEYETLLNYVELGDESLIGSDRLWCLFNNQIIDLTNESHPGGNYIWHQIKGREISRFMYGAYGLESTSVKPHVHSEYALAKINKISKGTLKPIPFYYEKASSSQSLINFDQLEYWWTLETVQPISTTISYFGFQNPQLTYRTSLSGIESFGRYFIIRSADNKIAIRPYTMILCMAKPNVEYRKQLLIFTDCIINRQVEPKIPVLPNAHHELPLIIKKYESDGGFSQHIHADNYKGQYLIQGPYGVTFDLPQEGEIAIICGGTGLLPFLDLLDYFLKYTIYEAVKAQAGEEIAKFANIADIKFRKLKLHMFLAVNSEEDLIGKDIYFAILSLQKYLVQPNFKLILKGKFKLTNVQTTTKRFDQGLLMTEIEEIRSISRFLICGPPPMNKEMPKILRDLGVDKKAIHLV